MAMAELEGEWMNCTENGDGNFVRLSDPDPVVWANTAQVTPLPDSKSNNPVNADMFSLTRNANKDVVG